MSKKNESPLSKKMKPVRVGLCALILSSHLATFGTIAQAATVDSSQVSEEQVLEKEIKDAIDPSKEDPLSEEAEIPEVEEKNSEEKDSSISVEESSEVPIEEVSSEEEATEATVEEESVFVEGARALSEDNLLINSDFSLTRPAEGQWTGPQPENWELWIPNNITTKDYTAEINEEKQLVLSSEKDPFRASVHQTIAVNSENKYKLSFDVKMKEKVSYARVRIVELTDGKQGKTWYTPNLSGTANWQTIKEEFNVSPGVDSIKVELFVEQGTGTVWYDNVQVEAIEEETVPPIETPEDTTLEESISISSNGIYLPKMEKYEYVVRDSGIAESKGGLIFGRAAGETIVDVKDEGGESVGEIPLTVETYVESEYDQLLKTWNGITTGNEYFDSSNDAMNEQNILSDEKVEAILADYQQNSNKDYLWSDVTDYKDSKSLTTSYRKIETVAKQITQSESKFYQSEPAIRMVKEALKWLHDEVYNVNSEIVGNWWDYEIGTPRALGNSLALMQNYFSQEEIMKYTDPIQKFVPDPYHFRHTLVPFKALAGNLIDMGRVKIIQGALRQDGEIVKETIESLSQALEYAKPGGEGFFEDGSYIDHTNVAYTGAYGNVLIDGLSQLLPVVLQTGYLDESKLEVLYQFIDRAFIPMMYKGQMMDLTRGRSISRIQNQGHVAGAEVIRGVMRIAEVSEPALKERLNSTVKTLVVKDTYYDIFDNLNSYKDISLMQDILGDDSIKLVDRPTSLHLFNTMDKVVYQNSEKDFALGISMYSDKTQNYEYMNKENAKGWHTADGAIYFYNDDLSHYSDNYWPTVDPQFLAGTTVLLEDRADGSGQTTMPSGFVGGTKQGEHAGTVAMDFTNWNKQLTAKKSWFILGDKIVFLGADINNTSDSDAVTTVENRKLNATEEYEVYANGEKVALNKGELRTQNVQSVLLNHPENPGMNVGYVFLEDTNLHILDETRSGAWSDINDAQADEVFTNDFVTMYQDHKTENDTYAYTMYPNATKEELSKAAADPQIEVLRNDKQVQSVYDSEMKQWGVVLYENQSYELKENLTLKEQGVYSIHREGNQYMVSYYNPISDVTKEYEVEAGKDPETEETATISYSTHVQSQGWLEEVKNGEASGTEGLGKRLEGIKVSLPDSPYKGSVEYQTHVQSKGWMDWVKDGERSGTEGQGKRLEAIRLQLTDEMAEKYDIYYRVHSETYGWLDWAKNGAEAGTEGLAKRLESIQIKLVEKGEPAPGSTTRPYVTSKPVVSYTTHVQGIGWQDYVTNGNLSGTQGKALRLEGIKLNVSDPAYKGGIEYRTHVQTKGWQDWKANDTVSGTEGEALRLEAIQIKLTEELKEKYDVYYRVHAETLGWLGWAKNGESAGTEGLAKRLEGIEVTLVEKGKNAPGSTIRPNVKNEASINYVTHVEKDGWQKTVSNGEMSGTAGKGLRLEGIKMNITDPTLSGTVQYRTHVQKEGWQDRKQNWEMSGTKGKALRLEAIQINLTGEMAQIYDVYYRVHAETYGWLGWAKNGASAGTEGLAKRLEGIEVQLVLKGNKAPGSTTPSFIKK